MIRVGHRLGLHAFEWRNRQYRYDDGRSVRGDAYIFGPRWSIRSPRIGGSAAQTRPQRSWVQLNRGDRRYRPELRVGRGGAKTATWGLPSSSSTLPKRK